MWICTPQPCGRGEGCTQRVPGAGAQVLARLHGVLEASGVVSIMELMHLLMPAGQPAALGALSSERLQCISKAYCCLPTRPCRPASGSAAEDVTPPPASGLNVRTRVQVGMVCLCSCLMCVDRAVVAAAPRPHAAHCCSAWSWHLAGVQLQPRFPPPLTPCAFPPSCCAGVWRRRVCARARRSLLFQLCVRA